MIEPAVLAQRGRCAEDHADDRADRSGQEDEYSRVDEPGLDQGPHRLPVRQRSAEPAGEEP
jgi:hypothetical protein